MSRNSWQRCMCLACLGITQQCIYGGCDLLTVSLEIGLSANTLSATIKLLMDILMLENLAFQNIMDSLTFTQPMNKVNLRFIHIQTNKQT